MVEGVDPNPIHSKRKAISVLLPYAVFLEQSGEQRMVDAISHAVRATRPKIFIWYHVKPFIAAMFKKPNPPSLNWVLGLISPHMPWDDKLYDENMVARQASSASHEGLVSWTVADELLHMAFTDSLQPHIPEGFLGRPEGTGGGIIHQVRGLGSIQILKSYLLLAWSEWSLIDNQSGGLAEMQRSIQEDFCGIWMVWHRKDLIKRLDHILVTLNWELLRVSEVEHSLF